MRILTVALIALITPAFAHAENTEEFLNGIVASPRKFWIAAPVRQRFLLISGERSLSLFKTLMGEIGARFSDVPIIMINDPKANGVGLRVLDFEVLEDPAATSSGSEVDIFNGKVSYGAQIATSSSLGPAANVAGAEEIKKFLEENFVEVRNRPPPEENRSLMAAMIGLVMMAVLGLITRRPRISLAGLAIIIVLAVGMEIGV